MSQIYKGSSMLWRPKSISGQMGQMHFSSIEPVKSVDFILAQNQYQPFFKALLEILGPEDYPFYIKLIRTYTSYVQNFPATKDTYYAYPGGLLDFSLNAAYFALIRFNQYLTITDDKHIKEFAPYWRYSVLNAALLQNLDVITAQLYIIACQSDGKEIQEWIPYNTGSLYYSPTKVHYKYAFQQNVSMHLRNFTKYPLAWDITTKAMHLPYLMHNKQVLETWITSFFPEQEFETIFPNWKLIHKLIRWANLHALSEFMKKFLSLEEYFPPEIKKELPLAEEEKKEAEITKDLYTSELIINPPKSSADPHLASGNIATSIPPHVREGWIFLYWLQRLLQEGRFTSHADPHMRPIDYNRIIITNNLIEQYIRETHHFNTTENRQQKILEYLRPHSIVDNNVLFLTKDLSNLITVDSPIENISNPSPTPEMRYFP